MTTTTETVSTAVAKVGPSELVTAYTADFAAVLPSHIKPATWVRLAVGALRRDEKLRAAAEANPASLMVALLDAARRGLEPGTTEYYLTPRKCKQTENNPAGLEVLGITGYQGEVEMIYRAGAVSSVIVEVVRAEDTFTYAPGRDERPLHEIDWDLDDRGELRLAYSYAIMRDGATSKVVVLNKAHIALAKASSQGATSEYSPWRKHEESMWLKTAAHRLAKWVPTSAEYRRQAIQNANEIQGDVPPLLGAATPQPLADEADEVVQGEFVDELVACSGCASVVGGDHDADCTATQGDR